MLDPIPPPPAFLSAIVRPFADFFSLATLPLHIHEVLLAFLFYHATNFYLAPFVSTALFPKLYPALNARTRLNWDVHVVSLVQSCLINGLALWVMFSDDVRWDMDWRARVWGYDGAGGMIQAFATGYFLWDLCVSMVHVDVFGWGILAHAVSALAVFSLGFRPFVNYYGPNFILYELSSPFLNFHWFFDKVNMTGSRAQWYNGLALLFTFFSCRLVWGTYSSLRVYQDVMAALQSAGPPPAPAPPELFGTPEHAEVMRFAGEGSVPVWLAVTYLGANVTLNTLNFYWFGKMIETVRKRFRPKERTALKMEVTGGGEKVVTAEKTEVRKRRKA